MRSRVKLILRATVLCQSTSVSADFRGSPTYIEQVELALANVGKCLAAVGAMTRDIVKVTHYIVDYDPTGPSAR